MRGGAKRWRLEEVRGYLSRWVRGCVSRLGWGVGVSEGGLVVD